MGQVYIPSINWVLCARCSSPSSLRLLVAARRRVRRRRDGDDARRHAAHLFVIRSLALSARPRLFATGFFVIVDLTSFLPRC